MKTFIICFHFRNADTAYNDTHRGCVGNINVMGELVYNLVQVCDARITAPFSGGHRHIKGLAAPTS